MNIFSKSFAVTRLVYPEEMEVKELNAEEKDKLKSIKTGKSIKDNSTLGVPEQYKGPLKYAEPEQRAYLKDFRIEVGFGGSVSMFPTLKMKTITDLTYTQPSYNIGKEQEWEMPKNYNYNASLGLYWINGVRLEFEYKKMTIENKKFTNGFNNTCKGNDTNQPCNNSSYPLNVYLQKGSVLESKTYKIQDINHSYTQLSKNMQPIVNITVSTYMANIILEQVYVKSKARPYLGVGVGVASVNMSSLVNKGASNIPALQVMIGLSYPLADEKVALYIGYRGLFMQKIKQTFTRIVGTSCPDAASGVECNTDGIGYSEKDNGFYYNPEFEDSEQEYNIASHDISATVRFFF
ncbi:MAG: P44/Msp2 family outer membrane protein [Rickettsiales bacterium]|nr:P44/Msp2 family outer membrane protein [Rickettsiales bacterium]